MHAQNAVFNNSSDWQAVKKITKGFPELDIVPSLALIVESIHSADGLRFMVASQYKEIFRVFNLIGHQEAHHLNRVLSSIDIVSKEKVVLIWRKACEVEESQKVIILPMSIACYLNWSL